MGRSIEIYWSRDLGLEGEHYNSSQRASDMCEEIDGKIIVYPEL